jgi:uncharacterized membrane protein YgdD (TMEM256/DUF423 family)
MNSSRWILAAAGTLGFLGVALGAFGAHALKNTLVARGSADTWHTAVLYQLVHAVALLALAAWRQASGSVIGPVVWCWVAGVVFFSGSLYWLALGGSRLLGPVTPLGGLCFLAGWALLTWNAFKQTAA